jgi:hypothetical protein
LGARRFERGDYAASDVLIDLANAIKAAGLTPRQREALRLYYIEDMTLEDVGAAMGLASGRKRASRLVITGLNRIAAVFSRWNYGQVSRAEQWVLATESADVTREEMWRTATKTNEGEGPKDNRDYV